jgi:hypothetical protein
MKTAKTAPVDVKIIPVVRWLNSFDGVFTLHSCQGSDEFWEAFKKDPDQDSREDERGHFFMIMDKKVRRRSLVIDRPYVVFYSDFMEKISEIANAVLPNAEITLMPFRNNLRFSLDFFSQASMESFIKTLSDEFKE